MSKALVTVALFAALSASAMVAIADTTEAPAPAPAAPAAAVPAAPVPMPPLFQLSPAPCILQAMRITPPMLRNSALKLTEEQITQATDILNKADEAMKAKVEAQRKAAEAFVVALSKPDADAAKVTQAAQVAMQAETVLVIERIRMLSALRTMMNDEQKKAFSAYLEQRTMRWRAAGMPEAPGPGAIAPPPAPAAGK